MCVVIHGDGVGRNLHGITGAQCRRFGWTYDDDGSHKHQIPDEVLFPCKLGVVLLKLGQVCEDKIRVEEDAQAGTGQEETRYEAVDARRESPKEPPVEIERFTREHAGIHSYG